MISIERFESWADDILYYAGDNLETAGWDYIYENYSIEDIVNLISSCYSYDEAFALVARISSDIEHCDD